MPESGVARRPRAQHQRVDEETDESRDLLVRAPGDGRAHHYLRLTRVEVEQRFEGGQQQHEERDPFLPTERLKAFHQREGQGGRKGRPAVTLYGRARAIRGQLKGRGRVCQLLSPVCQLRLQHFTLEPFALPDGEVRVLYRQFLQGGGATFGKGPV